MQFQNLTSPQSQPVSQATQVHVTNRPEKESDPQEIFENHNYEKSLDPEEFAVDRGWWYLCRTCGGSTRVRTRHPYCRHCGFSPKTILRSLSVVFATIATISTLTGCTAVELSKEELVERKLQRMEYRFNR